MEVGLTGNELSPVPPGSGVPPQLSVYQSVVSPAPGLFTEIVDEDPEHIVAGVAAIPVGVPGRVFTVTVTLWQVVETQLFDVFLVRAK